MPQKQAVGDAALTSLKPLRCEEDEDGCSPSRSLHGCYQKTGGNGGDCARMLHIQSLEQVCCVLICVLRVRVVCVREGEEHRLWEGGIREHVRQWCAARGGREERDAGRKVLMTPT